MVYSKPSKLSKETSDYRFVTKIKNKSRKEKRLPSVKRTIENESRRERSSSGSSRLSNAISLHPTSRTPSPKRARKARSASSDRDSTLDDTFHDLSSSSSDEISVKSRTSKKRRDYDRAKKEELQQSKSKNNRLKAKIEILTAENRSLKKRSNKLLTENGTVKNKLENLEAENKKVVDKLTLDRNFWRSKAEKLESQNNKILRENPYKQAVERLVMNEKDCSMRTQMIYSDLEKVYGVTKFKKLEEVGSKSTEVSFNVRMKHIDMHKFATRRTKDIPLWNDEMTQKRCLLPGRIGHDGLYEERFDSGKGNTNFNP